MSAVLVVGIAGGVGLAVATLLHDRGFDVSGTVLDESQIPIVRATLPAVTELETLDLSDGDGLVARLSTFLAGRTAALDAVIVCSGIAPFGPLETASLSQLRKVLEINAVSCVGIYQACLPSLRRTRGRLIFISSMAGKVAIPFIGHYVASKFALEGLADVMRQEAHKWGVEISLIEPGGIDTPLVAHEVSAVRNAIDNLSDDESTRYGDLYRQFLGQLEANSATRISASDVAAATIGVLEAQDLITRREVGPGAIELCRAKRTLGDLELDLQFRKLYTALGS